MIDSDFEAKGRLLTNEGYFDRHRELCREMGVEQAWEQLERELPLGIRRYTSFHAFEAAKKKESTGSLGSTIFLKYIER